MADLDHLRQLAAQRKAARAALETSLNDLKELTKPGVLMQRAKAELTTRAADLSTQAFAIANDNRGIVVGTGLAVLGWLLRAPALTRVARWGFVAKLAARWPGKRARP